MKTIKDLSKIQDNQLLTNFSLVVQREREVISDLIVHLAELEKRKLYAAEAYPSLFSYLTEKYRYSGGAAYRRIQAAKLYQKFPEILELLQEGKLNLMTISLIEPHVNKEDGKKLMEMAVGKSQREIEDLLAEIHPREVRFKDVIRKLPIKARKNEAPLEEKKDSPKGHLFEGNDQGTSSAGNKNEKREIQRVKIEFVADESLAEMIERAKQVLRHKFPRGRLEEVFHQALTDMLEKRDPERKVARAEKKQQRPDEKKSTHVKIQRRYIPQDIRRAVWKRDGGQCSFRTPDGKRCRERGGIELDHVKPWGIGGDSIAENVRLLCRSHNAWRVGFMK